MLGYKKAASVGSHLDHMGKSLTTGLDKGEKIGFYSKMDWNTSQAVNGRQSKTWLAMKQDKSVLT